MIDQKKLNFINKLWLGPLTLFSYLTFLERAVYPVFSGVIYFYLSDFVFGLYDLLSTAEFFVFVQCYYSSTSNHIFLDVFLVHEDYAIFDLDIIKENTFDIDF